MCRSADVSLWLVCVVWSVQGQQTCVVIVRARLVYMCVDFRLSSANFNRPQWENWLVELAIHFWHPHESWFFFQSIAYLLTFFVLCSPSIILCCMYILCAYNNGANGVCEHPCKCGPVSRKSVRAPETACKLVCENPVACVSTGIHAPQKWLSLWSMDKLRPSFWTSGNFLCGR